MVLKMLEGKDYHSLDMVFHFVATFLNQSTGYYKAGLLTQISTKYSFIALLLCSSRKKWCDAEITNLEKLIQHLKSCTIKTFRPHFDSGIHSLRLHPLYYLEDIEKDSET